MFGLGTLGEFAFSQHEDFDPINLGGWLTRNYWWDNK